MKKLLGLLLSAALIMGALTSCAGTPAENNGTSSPETTPAVSETNSLEPSAADETDWPRTYTDARGKEVTLEKKPERIAVTTWMITENLLALETPPVASDTVEVISQWGSMKSYFEKYQIEDLGKDHLSINLEKLVETSPDLILATTINEKIYDQLEKIAPVIVLDDASFFDNWQTSVREISKIIGEETAAETFINKVLEEAEQGKANVEALGEITVGFARAWKKEFTVYSEQQLILFYDKENGLGLSSPLNWPTKRSTLSLEAFSEFDPDYIFLSGADQEFMDELSANSVWKLFTAVKNNHVFSIDLSALTGGPLAMRYGVQTVIDTLTN